MIVCHHVIFNCMSPRHLQTTASARGAPRPWSQRWNRWVNVDWPKYPWTVSHGSVTHVCMYARMYARVRVWLEAQTCACLYFLFLRHHPKRSWMQMPTNDAPRHSTLAWTLGDDIAIEEGNGLATERLNIKLFPESETRKSASAKVSAKRNETKTPGKFSSVQSLFSLQSEWEGGYIDIHPKVFTLLEVENFPCCHAPHHCLTVLKHSISERGTGAEVVARMPALSKWKKMYFKWTTKWKKMYFKWTTKWKKVYFKWRLHIEISMCQVGRPR